MTEIHEAHLTNGAYGFPSGKSRRIKSIALACIHVTGNQSTASAEDTRKAATAERNYANRAGSSTSAHYYLARDGWALEAIDPVLFAAWSNGIVKSPNSANPGIAAVLALRAKGYNANEAYVLEIECLGYGSSFPITEPQKVALAELIAAQAARTGLDISRETVHGHWELNGVDRRNCPVPYLRRETFLDDVIARARAIQEDPMPDVFAVPGTKIGDVPAGTAFYRDPIGGPVLDKTGGAAGSVQTVQLVGQSDATLTPGRYLVDGAGDRSGAMRWINRTNIRDIREAPAGVPEAKLEETVAAAIAADRARARIVYG